MQLHFRSDNSVSAPLAAIATVEYYDEHELMAQLYVDQVIARLTGVPEHLRADIRRELRLHLEATIAAHLELGADAETATAAAIQQFGDPKTIAARFIRAWRSTGQRGTPGAATRAALKTFCLGLVVYSLSMLHGVANGQNLHGSVDAAVRSGWFWCGLWVIPSIAGACFGWKFPRHSSRGSFYALSMLTAVSAPLFAVAIAYGNQPGSTLYTTSWYAWAYFTALFPVVLIWLPIGSLSALVVGRLRTRRDPKAVRA